MTPQDLIYQYITTGQIISKYQYDKLSNNEKKSYIRQRVLAAGQHSNYYVKDYEVIGLPPEDARKVMSSLDKKNIVMMMQTSNNLRQLLPYIDKKGIKHFKERCGAPDFKESRGITFLIESMQEQNEPELIMNLFTDDEKEIIRLKIELNFDAYTDIMEKAIQPLKIIEATGINILKSLKGENDYYIQHMLKRTQNPNDIITILYPQIVLRQITLDDEETAVFYIKAQHPLKIHQLVKWNLYDLSSEKITYSFARSNNITELIETYNLMPRIRDFKQYIQYLDHYGMRRILSTVHSVENLNTFINLMGDKLIYDMKDYTDSDWEFTLRLHKAGNPEVYNELLKYQKQYG